jgi:hypothetical protein
MGLGRVNLLSGRIRCYRVRFGSAMLCVPASPLGCGAGQLGHVGYVRGEAAWARRGFGPNAGFLNKKSFSFLNMFYKLQINLNSIGFQ